MKAIAVTGSCGKTTTKDLAASILQTRWKGSKNEDTRNCGTDVARMLLAVSAEDDYFVQELGAWGPGTLDAGIALVRPEIAVVTNIRNDHHSSFRGPRGAQVEKQKLVSCLPPSGVAVLNWDDPLVREMAEATSATILSFGRHPAAMLRADHITARWPEPLSFTVRHLPNRDIAHGRVPREIPIRTRLLGEHLLGSALAALGVGVAFGMSIDDAASALAATEPTWRRMSTVVVDGVTFIRDDWKAPADSFVDVFAFLSSATASRRVAVIGTISDYAGRSRATYSRIAGEAVRCLDAVVFVGERAADLWGERFSRATADQAELRSLVARSAGQDDGGGPRGEMFVLGTSQAAHDFLRGYLAPGDLVLVKDPDLRTIWSAFSSAARSRCRAGSSDANA